MQQVETSTSTARQPAHQGPTTRKDSWWVQPLIVGLGFAAFGVYATYRAFENANFEVGHYLSPFYSPKIMLDFWHFSPAFLILWIPGGFRATCYYYRKAYYRAYFFSPPACAVADAGAGGKYGGENSFPLKMQNLHRYFFYLATIVLAFLWWDVFLACYYDGGLHFSLVSLIMLVNVICLSGYSFGCHAYRHLVGGRLDCFSCPSAHLNYTIWQRVTKLNEHHQFWAWVSLFTVGFTDFYIRQVCVGAFPEMKFF